MKRVAVNIFFVTVMEQSRCDYQDRSQYIYLKNMMMIPTYLNKYFCKNSCILVYPMQIGIGEQELGALKTIPHADSHDSLDELADVLRGLFKRNK